MSAGRRKKQTMTPKLFEKKKEDPEETEKKQKVIN